MRLNSQQLMNLLDRLFLEDSEASPVSKASMQVFLTSNRKSPMLLCRFVMSLSVQTLLASV